MKWQLKSLLSLVSSADRKSIIINFWWRYTILILSQFSASHYFSKTITILTNQICFWVKNITLIEKLYSLSHQKFQMTGFPSAVKCIIFSLCKLHIAIISETFGTVIFWRKLTSHFTQKIALPVMQICLLVFWSQFRSWNQFYGTIKNF